MRHLAALILCLPFIVPARMVHQGRIVDRLPMAPEERTALAKSGAAIPHYWPHPTGARTLAALLVDFSDSPADFTPAEVDSCLNQPGYSRFGNRGSIRDYYLDVSEGKLDLVYKVFGYYRAKKAKTYYENLGDYRGGDELMDEVISAFNSTVDYKAFGTSGESAINSIAILYAGVEHDGDLWGTTSWSDLTVDGRTAGRAYWACIGKTEMEIATFSHEMGHMLFNWPDLYNVPNAAGGVEAHCLMGAYADIHDPIPPNEALRADQGWIDVVDLGSASKGVYKAAANAPSAYRFANPGKPEEAFYVVNRKNTGRYSSLGGRGMLIFHFDMDWNEVQDQDKAAIVMVQDQGKIKPPSNWAEPGWYFYGANTPEFSYASQAAGNDWHGGTRSGIRLHSISALADTMTFAMGDISVGVRGTGMKPGLAGSAGRDGYLVNGARRPTQGSRAR